MNRTKRLQVLLVAPGYEFAPDGNVGDTHLVALGSYLQAHGPVDVQLCDLYYERLLPIPCPERVFDPCFDIVGLSCYSSFDYLKTFYLGVAIRRRRPDVVLVVGGYHPSARPGDFTGPDSPFDYVVVGEGEQPLQQIVAAHATGGRLASRVLGPEAVDDLDSLPPLDWHLLDRYRPVLRRAGRQWVTHLSRGCPFHCAFCMEGAKGASRWRAYSPDRAAAELLALQRYVDLDGWTLFLTDPLFGLQPDWRREMLVRLAKLALPVRKIWALTRADVLDPDQDLPLFQAANFGLGFGLESGDPAMLEIIHKGGRPATYLERFERLAAHAARLGLPWGANMIAGHPAETADSLARSAAWAKRLFARTEPLTGFLAVDPYRFYPGSPIDHDLAEYERRFGTRVHRPRWWNESEPAFTSTWIDPSAALTWVTRERLTAQWFGPILDSIARRFAYAGPAADYFQRSVRHQVEFMQPRYRLSKLRDYHLWRRLTGHRSCDVRLDPEAARLLRAQRGQTLATLADERPLSQAVHAALLDEPRERYVAAAWLWQSAQDMALPLDEGRKASLSALHAYVRNYALLDLQPGDRLLELGAGTGYGAAVAARLVGPEGRVRSVEIDANLACQARENLADRPQVEVVHGAATADMAAAGFNRILFCYAVTAIPQEFVAALPPGGRLLAPVQTPDGRQVLMLVEQTATGPRTTAQVDVCYVPDRDGAADCSCAACKANESN